MAHASAQVTRIAETTLDKRQHDSAEDALACWASGDWRKAKQCSQAALAQAVAGADRQLEGDSSLLLGQALVLESRFDWARRFLDRAQSVLLQQGRQDAAARATLSLCDVDAALGDEAAAAAAAGAAASQWRDDPRLRAASLNCLGVATLWSGNFTGAWHAFSEACDTVRGAGLGGLAFEPLVHAAFGEVLRCAGARLHGADPDPSALTELVSQARALAKATTAGSLLAGPVEASRFLLEFETCYLALLKGDIARADHCYLNCLKRAAWLPESSWMRGLLWWVRMERAIGLRDTQAIAESAEALVGTAALGEHAHMKKLALSLYATGQQHLSGADSPYATWLAAP